MAYPAGAANDSRAPFNHKSVPMDDCPDCEGTGHIQIDDITGDKCITCKGTGQVPADPSEREYDKYDEYDHE